LNVKPAWELHRRNLASLIEFRTARPEHRNCQRRRMQRTVKFGYRRSLAKWHGRLVRESRAAWACHMQTESLRKFVAGNRQLA